MADSGATDAAVVAALAADQTLAALMPDGVWLEEAPPGLSRYVIVSPVASVDTHQFGGRAFEDVTYLVKAVERSTSGGGARAAAARIDAVLEGGLLQLDGSPATGYGFVSMVREGQVGPVVEVDPVDPGIRWQHRGGFYRVVVTAIM